MQLLRAGVWFWLCVGRELLGGVDRQLPYVMLPGTIAAAAARESLGIFGAAQGWEASLVVRMWFKAGDVVLCFIPCPFYGYLTCPMTAAGCVWVLLTWEFRKSCNGHFSNNASDRQSPQALQGMYVETRRANGCCYTKPKPYGKHREKVAR